MPSGISPGRQRSSRKVWRGCARRETRISLRMPWGCWRTAVASRGTWTTPGCQPPKAWRSSASWETAGEWPGPLAIWPTCCAVWESGRRRRSCIGRASRCVRRPRARGIPRLSSWGWRTLRSSRETWKQPAAITGKDSPGFGTMAVTGTFPGCWRSSPGWRQPAVTGSGRPASWARQQHCGRSSACPCHLRIARTITNACC